MKNIFIFIAIFVASNTTNVVAQESRVELSTFESSLKDHARTHENSWEYWGLTQDEWVRYESIKQKSPWATWKNEATPLAILSHYATSIADKSRYAHLEAELDQWRENTVLEWQLIYNKEREIIYAKNTALLGNRKPDLKNIKPSDRVLYFVETGECNTRCRATTTRLLSTFAHIDVFVIGAKVQKDVFEWATSAKIPVERVRVKQITLNFDNDNFAAVTSTPKSLLEFPMAYIQTKDGYKAVIF